jgi:DNA-binding MarR family transcriptional regulator
VEAKGAGEINLTEAEVLEANLRALGIADESVGPSIEARSIEALATLIRKHGRLVSTREVADEIGFSPNTVLAALNRAEKKGLVFRKINSKTSRPCFVPKVV